MTRRPKAVGRAREFVGLAGEDGGAARRDQALARGRGEGVARRGGEGHRVVARRERARESPKSLTGRRSAFTAAGVAHGAPATQPLATKLKKTPATPPKENATGRLTQRRRRLRMARTRRRKRRPRSLPCSSSSWRRWRGQGAVGSLRTPPLPLLAAASASRSDRCTCDCRGSTRFIHFPQQAQHTLHSRRERRALACRGREGPRLGATPPKNKNIRAAADARLVSLSQAALARPGLRGGLGWARLGSAMGLPPRSFF